MNVQRAAYASDPARSRGRLYPQNDSDIRTPFQRDRDRIIHSAAFRRLKHKTQVFVSPDGDHFRTRLTHSLEVAQIGRTLARAMGLDEDLTEALCLAHDLGHPPFGHVGEDALDARMQPYGGFDHNGHSIRMVTMLETPYADFDGLNLTWETLEGLAKHNGPVHEPRWALAAYDARHDLALTSHASLEAQVAALADDIAYNNHDLDDGLRAGLFSLDALLSVPFVAENWCAVEARYPRAARQRLVAELVRHQIGLMVRDLMAATQMRIAHSGVQSVEDVRAAGLTLACFSPEMMAAERSLKGFLRDHMYFHPRNQAIRGPAGEVVEGLFDLLMDDPRRLPEDWQTYLPDEEGDRARHISDFIAGMTDRYALRAFRKLGGQVDFPADGMI